MQTANLAQVPSLFDENAAEAAVRLKESGGGKVVAICCGPPEAERTVRYPLALGGDEAVLIEDADRAWDSMATASILAAAVRRLGGFDVILCGREAADTGSGMVGPYVAQMLGMPFLTLVTDIEMADGVLRVRRMCEGGEDVFSCKPPILLTVSSEANRPRYPSVMKVMAAKKKPIQRWKASELEAAVPTAAGNLLGRSTASAPGNCELISGDTPDALAGALLSRLREKRVI